MKSHYWPLSTALLLFTLLPVPPPAQVHLMRANVYVVRHDLAGALQEIDECLKLAPPGPLAEATHRWRAALQARMNNTPGP